MTPWKQPTRRRVRAIRDRLRKFYGRPFLRAHRAPLDELVLTVLSQNTNDRNRDIAYTRLRKRLPTWAEVEAASVSVIERAIRPGGISKVKSKRIRAILTAVAKEGAAREQRDPLDLSWLNNVDPAEARHFLESLPGVGRKTAACVLLFSYGIPEIPVDTHVFRVSTRLGLIRPNSSFEEAHEVMLKIVAPADSYEFHVSLLRHGRKICKSRPLCPGCPLRRGCPAYKTFYPPP